MPDLDDIFEDIFDAAKKLAKRKRKKKKSKKRKEQAHVQTKPTMLERLLSTSVDKLSSNGQTAYPQKTVASSTEVAGANPIKSDVLREYLEQAKLYESGILELARNAPNEFNRTRLEDLSRYIDHWHGSCSGQ